MGKFVHRFPHKKIAFVFQKKKNELKAFNTKNIGKNITLYVWTIERITFFFKLSISIPIMDIVVVFLSLLALLHFLFEAILNSYY